MKRKLYQELATCVNAYLNCQETFNFKWKDIWEERVESLVEEYMPSGSGFDNGTELLWFVTENNREVLEFQTHFHHMDENGSYTEWTHHKVRVWPSLQFGFTLVVKGRNVNGIKEYISDVFYEALEQEVESVTAR